ncbi:mediator complex subunit MED14-domain-containing protein [Glomus cerebriforme]|uniref:Mediator of RNA polymerase II transcription subunit 14 n=1 Tax=Glomus cerebriforme TaxID=658196 RepID=A0A397THX2_9GLOM|nr:mediator complex subunit MED14-domain-containing protein [Glomus cerebriforme]
MENLSNTEIQRSHTVKSQQWKPLTDVVDAVNCDAHDKLATFIHRQVPEAGDTDRRKTFMLNYLLPQRNNWLKLKTLVSWSEKACLVHNYEIHYKDVQRQKLISNDVEASMREWSFYMPGTSIRSPDVTSSSDVLKEGTYKRFPSIIKERFAPDVLGDDKAKETLEALNNIIQIRMLTQEIIPKCMRNYSISNGKIKFIIDREFETVLTPLNMEIDSAWWIIELKFFIQSASDKIFNDVKLSFHDDQLLRLMETIQIQYLSPPKHIPERIASSMKRSINAETLDATFSSQTAKFCPLVNLYEYLHNYCLDLQLNILAQQAHYIRQTRWANNFDMIMNEEKSVLRISYWNYIKQAALAVKAQSIMRSNVVPGEIKNHDIIEIFVTTEESDRHLLYSSNKALKRSHWYTDTKYVKLGALNDFRGINYPHKFLCVRWSGLKGSEANEWIVIDWEFDPTNLNIEHLMLSITQRHAQAVVDKFVEILKNEKGVYTENNFEIVSGNNELISDLESLESPFSDEIARKYLNVQKLRVRLCGEFKDYFINIGIDIHSGRIFIEDEKQEIESDKIKACEDKLSYDHNKLIEVLIMLRSVVMRSRLESIARKLFLDVPRNIQIIPEDIKKLHTTQKIILEFNDVKDVDKMLSHKGIPDKTYYLIAGLVEIVYHRKKSTFSIPIGCLSIKSLIFSLFV